MIAEHDTTGMIFHIIQDPVPPGMADRLTALGKTFIDVPPTPLPDLPVLGENGEPVVDIETRELFEEDGITPRRDQNGEQLVEVISTPRMITGRTQGVAVSFDQHYVLSGVLTERPTLPVPAQIVLTQHQIRTISDLPAGCVVKFAGETIPLPDGSMDIEGEEIGSFQIQFECWPYRDANCEVIVNEA